MFLGLVVIGCCEINFCWFMLFTSQWISFHKINVSFCCFINNFFGTMGTCGLSLSWFGFVPTLTRNQKPIGIGSFSRTWNIDHLNHVLFLIKNLQVDAPRVLFRASLFWFKWWSSLFWLSNWQGNWNGMSEQIGLEVLLSPDYLFTLVN